MNTGVGSLFLLQRIFLTQESNQGLLESLSAELPATPCMCVCVFVYVYVCVCVHTIFSLSIHLSVVIRLLLCLCCCK